MHLYELIGGDDALKEKRKFALRVSQLMGDLFEMPSGGVPGGVTVTVADGCEVYMTGCREILAYESVFIKVSTSLGAVVVTGEGLDIPKYTDGELTVRGTVDSVELLREE